MVSLNLERIASKPQTQNEHSDGRPTWIEKLMDGGPITHSSFRSPHAEERLFGPDAPQITVGCPVVQQRSLLMYLSSSGALAANFILGRYVWLFRRRTCLHPAAFAGVAGRIDASPCTCGKYGRAL